MLKPRWTNIQHQPIKIRRVLHYLILLTLVIAVSLPAAIFPAAGPVQATEPLPVPWLFAPYSGYITNDNTVDLFWSDVDPPRAFEYQVDNNSDFSSPEVDATQAELIPSYLWRNIYVRAYTATTRALTDGTYYWRVRTYLGSEYGNWTETWSFTVDTVPTAAPGLVSPANGSLIADHSPTLHWNVPAGVARFEWQVADNAGFSPLYSSAIITSVIYTFPSPIPCNHYYWRVRAIDMAGNISAWSPTWNFWLLYPPDLPSPANGSYVNTLTPAITWNAVPGDAISYQLQVDNQSNFSSPNTNAYWITQNTYTTVTLTEGTTYYWRVRSHLDTATSAWSPVWHFTTDTTPPAVPALVSPFNGADTVDTTPTLDWNPVSGAATYEWQISTVPAFLSDPVNPNSTTATEYTFPSSLPYDTYYWRVRARDAAGNAGRWSAIWYFTIFSGTASPPGTGPQPGETATGGGWYTLEDGSRVNFSFAVNQVPRTADPTQFKGEVLLTNDGKWRLKGNLETYLHDNFQGWASGSGQLYSWDSASKKGDGWLMAGDNIGFTVHFIDINSSIKDPFAIDRFGINISYFPDGGASLPNSDPMELKGGNIDIKDIKK